MRERPFILVIFSLAIALLLAGAGFFAYKGLSSNREIEYSPTEGAVREEEIGSGELGIKYLAKSELRRLGIKRDVSIVKYLAKLDLTRWALACQSGMDCIPAITRPTFESVGEADEWLGDGDLVIGVRSNGIAKAYPLRVMNWHQVVNDYLNDQSIVATFCPISGAALIFERPLANGKPLEFGISGRLYNANLLMYDRKTGSLWQQFEGQVIAGPLLGVVGPLTRVPADIVPWGAWKKEYPESLVLARPTSVRTPSWKAKISLSKYEQYPYARYQLRRWVGYGVDVDQLELRGVAPKRKVIGVYIDGAAKAYVESEIWETKLLNDRVGGEEILVVFTLAEEIKVFKRSLPTFNQTLTFALENDQLIDQQTVTQWSFDGVPLSGKLAVVENQVRLEEVPATPIYWFTWLLFNPETELFSSN